MEVDSKERYLSLSVCTTRTYGDVCTGQDHNPNHTLWSKFIIASTITCIEPMHEKRQRVTEAVREAGTSWEHAACSLEHFPSELSSPTH